MPVLFFSGGGNPLPDSAEEQQRLAANLRDYIDRGGFIFADGEGCGSDFDHGFRRLMELTFQKPEYRFKPLDAAHPVWIAEEKIPPDQVRLLLGIDYGVIFSEFDLSCALEKHDSMECRGYTREDAARIGLNVLRYGMQQ